MEKDDFKYQLSFGEDVFGGPRWRDLVGAEAADRYVKSGAVPVMLDPDGPPGEAQLRPRRRPRARRSCKAIDHPAARRQTFNVCMDEPVDYGELGAYLTPDARPADGPDRDAVPFDLARQQPRPSSCSAGGPATT